MYKKYLWVFRFDPITAPFLYRKRLPEDNELFDSVNGVFPYADRDTMISINLNAQADANGHVDKITYYKVRDHLTGHGRPAYSDKELTRADEKMLIAILEKSTISRAEQVLPVLLEKAINEGLPGNWRVQKHTKSTVSFCSPSGDIHVISKQHILFALEISYSHIEILSEPLFWEANEKYLKPTDQEALLCLFSLVDTSTYYNRGALIEQAEHRKKRFDQFVGYQALCEAAKDNDLECARQYYLYAKEKKDRYTKIPSPLEFAVQHQNQTMIRELLEAGVSADEGDVLMRAVQLFDVQIVKLLLEYIKEKPGEQVMAAAKKDGTDEILRLLLQKGGVLIADDDWLKKSQEYIASFAEYQTIIWKPEHLELMYKSGNITALSSMIASIANCAKNHIACWQLEVVEWAIKKQDANLLQILVGHEMKCPAVAASVLPLSCFQNVNAFPQACLELLPSIFQDPSLLQKALQAAFTEMIAKRDLAACNQALQRLHLIVTNNDIVAACRQRYKTASGSMRECGKLNDDIVSLVIENYKLPVDFIDLWESDFAKVKEKTAVGLLIEYTMTAADPSLALSLFEKIPETLEHEVFIETILYYSRKRPTDQLSCCLKEKILAFCNHRITKYLSGLISLSSKQLIVLMCSYYYFDDYNTDKFASLIRKLTDNKSYNVLADFIVEKYDTSLSPVYRFMTIKVPVLQEAIDYLLRHAENDVQQKHDYDASRLLCAQKEGVFQLSFS